MPSSTSHAAPPTLTMFLPPWIWNPRSTSDGVSGQRMSTSLSPTLRRTGSVVLGRHTSGGYRDWDVRFRAASCHLGELLLQSGVPGVG